jgi:type II secretory pathway pseudopilin PulG
VNRTDKNLGFTLVELMLAMSFAAVLLIAIAMTVMQIGNIYERGITLKEVDQSGRAIASELQKNINDNESFKLNSCPYSSTLAPNCNFVDTTWGGRLCIGQYSYIWNNGDVIKSNPANLNRYAAPDQNKSIRFLKVIDPGGTYCSTSNMAVAIGSATELLSVSQHDLAIHGFKIIQSASDSMTGQQLYSIIFLLGTNDQSAIKYTAGQDPRCKTPNEAGADQTYCSINKFNVLTRAGSVSG